MTSSAPISSARVRLSIETLMKFVGAEDVGVDRDARAGPAEAPSGPRRRPRVTCSVLPQGYFSTISSRPGPPLTTASPEQRLRADRDDWRRRRGARPWPVALDGDLRQVVRRDDRQLVVDEQSLVRGVDEAAGADRRADSRSAASPTSSASRRVVHQLLERDLLGAHAVGVDEHVVLLQVLAPDRDVGDAGNPQQACPDLPVADRRQVAGSTSCSRRRRSSRRGRSSTWAA